MKLLLYSHFFAPSVGGVETITMSLAVGLSQLRTADGRPEFEVTVVTQTPADSFQDNMLPFAILRRPGLAELLRRIRTADIIHVAGPALSPLFWSWLMRKPFVIEHHGYQAICPNGLLLIQPQLEVCPGHFQARHYFRCLRCNSAELGKIGSFAMLVRTFPRLWLSQRAILNLSISGHVLHRQGLPRSLNCYYGVGDTLTGELHQRPFAIRAENLRFAYVGRLVPEKGPQLLLPVVRSLCDEGFRFAFLFVGDGPLRGHLEETTRRLQLTDRVRFTGFLRGEELAECLRSVHVVVMPSIWEETAGLAAIEQMMAARLVIASNIGGLGEVVGGAGLKFEPGSAKGLAECMRRVLNNPATISEFGARARARALELFQQCEMVHDHAGHYRRIRDSQR